MAARSSIQDIAHHIIDLPEQPPTTTAEKLLVFENPATQVVHDLVTFLILEMGQQSAGYLSYQYHSPAKAWKAIPDQMRKSTGETPTRWFVSAPLAPCNRDGKPISFETRVIQGIRFAESDLPDVQSALAYWTQANIDHPL